MNSPDKTDGYNVGLLITCLADLFRPQIGFASVELIELSGCKVFVPEQSCCGQPAFNSGDDEKSRIMGKSLIKQFETYDYLVVPSGSCAAMVKQHYPDLFRNESDWDDRAQALADKTYELSQFLADVMEIDLETRITKFLSGKKITYHDSCSGLRELGIRSQPRKLLKHGAGIEITEMANSEICCGFGGTFCVKYPEISTRLVDNKISGIDETDADIVSGGDLGCLMNIAGRLQRTGCQRQVFHFAELLCERIPEFGIVEAPEKS